MAFLSGNARKVDGDPIDFVLVFNWLDGSDVSVIKPDSTGAWSMEPLYDMDAGITYVAGGTKPITHGPYPIKGSAGPKRLKGYLAVIWSANNRVNDGLNVAKTEDPAWNDNFSTVVDIGLFNYLEGKVGSGGQLTTTITKTMLFSINWVLAIKAQVTGGGGRQLMTIEIMDSDDVVLAAIKCEGAGSFSSLLYYGPDLTTMTQSGKTGSSNATNGTLRFSESGLTFTSSGGNNSNNSFSFAADLSTARAMRVSGFAKADYSTETGSYIKLLPPA